MTNQIRIHTTSKGVKRIAIECDSRRAWEVRSIHGIMYDPKVRIWFVPLSPLSLAAVDKTLPDFPKDDHFKALLEKSSRQYIDPLWRTDESQPETRMTDAWPHQCYAYNFAMKCGDAACLYMAMGTGKSRVAIDLIANRVLDGETAIIVSPLGVLPVWLEQIKRWGGARRWTPYILDSRMTVQARSQLVEHAMAVKSPGIRVFIVNYDSVWRDPLFSALRRTNPAYVICDESHRIKAHNSLVSRGLAQLGAKARYRLALSGTVMSHSPLDVFGQWRFLNEDIFGKSFTRFKQTYVQTDGEYGERIVGWINQDDFRERLDRIMFRLDSNKVLNLPASSHVNRYVTLEPHARKIHNALQRELFAEWQNKVITADNALVKVLRLQQITGGTVRDDDDSMVRVSTAKRSQLIELLDELDPNEPVVVFTVFRSELEDIRYAAEANNRAYFEQSGSIKQRAEWVADTGGSVIAVQIQSGSEGIDLTRARYCVYYSTGYSLGRYEQSLARVHRPGQERNVLYIHLIAQGTIDERIQTQLANRKDTIDAILADEQHELQGEPSEVATA